MRYLIETSSGRIVSGVFFPLTDKAMAMRILLEFKANNPDEKFYLKES
jgi:hypothetical protein